MKDIFKKVLLVFLLCFAILPLTVSASEGKAVEKDFSIEVSGEEVNEEEDYEQKDSSNDAISMLLVGIINHVYAEELKGEDISQTEQVKIDS